MGPDLLALIISSLTVESGRETSLPWKVSGVTLVSDLQSRMHRTAEEWKQNHIGFPFQWISFTEKNKWCETLGTAKPREEVKYSENFYIRKANRMFHIKIKESIFFSKASWGGESWRHASISELLQQLWTWLCPLGHLNTDNGVSSQLERPALSSPSPPHWPLSWLSISDFSCNVK